MRLTSAQRNDVLGLLQPRVLFHSQGAVLDDNAEKIQNLNECFEKDAHHGGGRWRRRLKVDPDALDVILDLLKERLNGVVQLANALRRLRHCQT